MTTPAADDNLANNPDRSRWNDRYATTHPQFQAHPLLASASAAGIPAGPVLELAGGPSGSALALARAGRDVTVVDVSDRALCLLDAEARRQGLGDRITGIHADLLSWTPSRPPFALVLCTNFWSATTFTAACSAVAESGLLGWEAYVLDHARVTPSSNPDWYLRSGEPDNHLPAQFTVLTSRLLAGRHGPTRRLLSRRNRIA